MTLRAQLASWVGFLGLATSACVGDPPPPEPQPLVCSTTIDGCECGQVGCSCADDGRCVEGACNANTGTCVLERDGMVYVTAGTSWMGCNPQVDPIGDAFPEIENLPRNCEEELHIATPYRQVTLDAYWIDRTEVTKADYRACIEAGVCPTPTEWDEEYTDDEQNLQPTPEEFPAGALTFAQAKTYCEWAGERLPTEAEWEKAARGTDGRKYPWGDSPEPDCTLATHIWDGPDGNVSCSDRKLTAVGSLPANTSPFGAVDMAGNVQEWTVDVYEEGAGYEGLPNENPVATEGAGRIRRGCSYQCPTAGAGGYILRTSFRFSGGADTTWEFLAQGVRCARSDHQ